MVALRNFWTNFRRRNETAETAVPSAQSISSPVNQLDLDIAPNDPLLTYFQSTPGVVDISKLEMDSPALAALKAISTELVVPLVSQGELIGLINLGPRLSEQEYSSDDRKLLGNLATQAAPALRVAQLVQQQRAEALERGRMEQELRIAGVIQQTLLPKSVPALDDFAVSAYYQPAREVGGDFYEFLPFEDGRIAFVIGDVTDKGVPAALVMATTRTLIRAASEQLESPGAVLQRVNDLLYPDIPDRMFVTCLYALLDLDTGRLTYANADHDLPYRRHADGVDELRARGMPLGLMPGMNYEEKEVTLQPGDTVLFYSDGLAEAHNPAGEMFGFPRLQAKLTDHPGGAELVPYLLEQLAAFTGPDWEQEDDVTLMILQHTGGAKREETMDSGEDKAEVGANGWQTLTSFELPSEPGREREAMNRVAAAIKTLDLPQRQFDRLKTAVAEATMNAMEHGNGYQADIPAAIEVCCSDNTLLVRITDQGGDKPIPDTQTPDLDAKLSGEQSARGWGLFLIKNMVDRMRVKRDEAAGTHTIELEVNLNEGEQS